MKPKQLSFNIDLNNPEFIDCWNLLQYTRQSVFLTGKAGTGKSTFLKYITANTRKKYVVLAPTGIAAVNVGGQTMHSFFRLPFRPFVSDDVEFQPKRLRERMKYSGDFIKLLKQIELIIIDEISMVRADIIDFIDRILREFCHNRREPFAGKQLLLVGDIFQLEPVVTGDVKDVLAREYSTPFFFSAKAFREVDLVPIELRKVYRQTDSGFIQMLDRIRDGRPLRSDIDTLNRKVNPLILDGPAEGDDRRLVMTIATRKDTVDTINESRLAELKSKELVYEGQVTGEFPESSYPTDLKLRLKTGAQVVFIKNDIDRRWVNGTLGKVVETLPDKIRVELDNGDIHVIERERWSNIRYRFDEKDKKVIEEELGSFMQYPLKLAWALTIHKSQGLTFDRVVVDLGSGAFSGGQSYVALSRCTSLDGLTLRTTINERDVWVNPNVLRFSQSFNNNIAIQQSLQTARADGLYDEALLALNEHRLPDALEKAFEAINLGTERISNPAVMRLARRKLGYIGEFERRIECLEAEIDRQRKILFTLATEQVELAEQCRDAGDMDAALANYRRATELAPEYHYAWMGRGLTLAAMGEYDAALSDLRHASALAPDDYHAPLHAGQLALNAGDLSTAMDLLLSALERNNKIADTHESLAEIYDALGETKQASAHRAKAARLRKRKK